MVDDHKDRLRTAIRVYGHYRFRLGMESVFPPKYSQGAAEKKIILQDKLTTQNAKIDKLINELEYAAVHVYEKGLD
tara:strand:+ start:1623 stop:1850 length:228 start_codon:yes stop_codon:yes gene_type:complete